MKHLSGSLLVLAATVTLSLAGGRVIAAPTSQPSFDDYKLLTQQNMFLRERPRPRVREPRSNKPAEDLTTPEAIEKYTVLRGVVIEDNELHAYVENTRTGVARKLVVGDLIGNGRVTDIGIDAVAFESGGRSSWIEIGDNLQGASVAPPVYASSTTLPSDTANMSMADRLKARRLKELGKQ